MLLKPNPQRFVMMIMMAFSPLGWCGFVLSAPASVILIKSPTDRSQLLVSEKVTDKESGRIYDLDSTREAKYLVENPTIARVDDRGGVIGLADGKT
ncbi:MAG: hypothetical protein DWH73_04070, partial [Planctomycetota bacterium]